MMVLVYGIPLSDVITIEMFYVKYKAWPCGFTPFDIGEVYILLFSRTMAAKM